MTAKKPIPESAPQARDRLKSKSVRDTFEALNAAVREGRLVTLLPEASDVKPGIRPRSFRRKHAEE